MVGITNDDTPSDAEYIVKKLLKARLFDGDAPKPTNGEAAAAGGIARPIAWKSSVVDIDAEILCVSQFTLYGSLSKGNKPDFHAAMNSASSKGFYHAFLDSLRKEYKADKIQDGQFGAMMTVDIANDGPVTLLLDSRAR